jgi:hypothetical protein
MPSGIPRLTATLDPGINPINRCPESELALADNDNNK